MKCNYILKAWLDKPYLVVPGETQLDLYIYDLLHASAAKNSEVTPEKVKETT